MRILLLTDYFPPAIGGIASYVEDLSTCLSSRGNEVFVCANTGHLTNEEHKRKIIFHRAQHVGLYIPFLYRQAESIVPPIPDPLFIKTLGRTVREFNPDIIHAHGSPMFPLAFFKRRMLEIPALATLHDYAFVCPKRDMFNTLTQRACIKTYADRDCIACSRKDLGIVKSAGLVAISKILKCDVALNNLDCLVAISNYVAQIARRKLRTRIFVIPDFITIEGINNDNAEKQTDILYVGALIPAKGVYVLQMAMRRLIKELPKLNVLVVGKTHAQYDVKFDKHFTILRNLKRTQVLKLYSNTKVVVVPSIVPEAGQNLVVLEAMHFGRPVVASDIGGLKDTIVNGKTGFLVPPNDAEALAEALKTLLTDENLAARMGKAAKKRFEEVYNKERIVAKLEGVYEDAIRLSRN